MTHGKPCRQHQMNSRSSSQPGVSSTASERKASKTCANHLSSRRSCLLMGDLLLLPVLLPVPQAQAALGWDGLFPAVSPCRVPCEAAGTEVAELTLKGRQLLLGEGLCWNAGVERNVAENGPAWQSQEIVVAVVGQVAENLLLQI